MNAVIDPSAIRKDVILPILSRIAIFGALPDESLDLIISHLTLMSVRDGDIIFNEGDPPDNIYIVLSGKVRIVGSVDTHPFELTTFNVGDCFGEMSVIGIQPHSAAAIGQGDTELLVLARPALMHLSKIDPRGFNILVLNIAREACRRLLATDHKLMHYRANGAGPA